MLVKEEYDIKLAAVFRFLRTYIPQIPALTVFLVDKANGLNLPYWIVPTLVFVGAVATALDKYIRELRRKSS